MLLSPRTSAPPSSVRPLNFILLFESIIHCVTILISSVGTAITSKSRRVNEEIDNCVQNALQINPQALVSLWKQPDIDLADLTRTIADGDLRLLFYRVRQEFTVTQIDTLSLILGPMRSLFAEKKKKGPTPAELTAFVKIHQHLFGSAPSPFSSQSFCSAPLQLRKVLGAFFPH